jgi:hypothetical protein
MAGMEWRSSRKWISPNGNGNEIKKELDPVFREYCQAAEAFAVGVIRPSSVYDLMVVKQRYLLAAAALLKSLSDIFAYRDVSLAASLFEAAAWAYLDNSDLQAQLQGQDNRFAPGEENFRLLRSRLKVIAERANRFGVLYSREIQETSNIEISSLRFLLSLVLDLPMSAWECAPCIAVIGRCSECSYGQDHGICSLPGSTYDMLCRSREAILKSIRRRLTEDDRSSEARRLLQEHNVRFDSSARSSSASMDIETCWEYDLVEACD